jgi:hypothetical protein
MPSAEDCLQVAETLASEDPGMAIVTAHMAFEVAAEGAFARLLYSNGAGPALTDAVIAGLPDRTFMDRRTREMWTLLPAGDEIKKARAWKPYQQSVQRRNRAVHKGEEFEAADAQVAVDAVQAMLDHLVKVVLDRFKRG